MYHLNRRPAHIYNTNKEEIIKKDDFYEKLLIQSYHIVSSNKIITPGTAKTIGSLERIFR